MVPGDHLVERRCARHGQAIGRLIDQHEAILDAVERGDAPASEAAIRTHLTEVLAVLEPLRRRYPDLFEPDER